MKELTVDAKSRTAVASPAWLGDQLNKILEKDQLIFPTARGHSTISRLYGPACANLKGADIVTADGDLIHADDKQNVDYFWAATARKNIDGVWTSASGEEILAAGRDVFLNLPSPEATMLWMQWGPVQKLPDMAYSLQGDTYLSPSILYRDATDDERIAGWVSGAIAKLRPISIGSQMNDENMPQNKGPYLSKEASTRLDAMRKKYDPEKRFPGFLS